MARFCAGFGLDPDAPGLATNRERVAPPAAVEVVEAAFADWDAEPLLARLAEIGVPAGKVRTIDEVYEWDQVASQGLLVEVDHAFLGPVTLPGPPLRFDDNVRAGGRDQHLAPPALGEHTDSVLAWLADRECSGAPRAELTSLVHHARSGRAASRTEPVT